MHIELPAHKWEPRQQQLRAWNALARGVRTAVLAWHRRMGKDEIALHNAAIKAMQRVGNYWHMLPMQEQARKALWEGVNPRTGRVRWKDAFPEEIIKHVDNQGMKVTFVNDSTWQLLGSDNYNCYSADTEVLTEWGWRLFSELTGLERVATLDEGKLVYAPINAVVNYPYTGEMYRVKNSSIDLLTTPNHNYYVESGKGVRKFKRIDDKTILGDKIPATCDWEGEERATYTIHGLNARNNVWQHERLDFDMHDWCAFMGIFLAEGSTFSDSKGNYRTIISQKKAHICKDIAALLKRMKLRYRYDTNPGNFVITGKLLFDYCSTFGLCHQKFVPHDLKRLAKPYLQTLVDWMVKGDGNINYNDTLSYASTSRKLIDDFQELMIKLGLSGNVRKKEQKPSVIRGRIVTPRLPLWVFNRRKSKFKHFKDTHESYVTKEHYEGSVWCVDAGSHVIKVRRNGFEAWCGNSLVGSTPVGITMSEAALADPAAFGYFRPILLENNGWSLHISSVRGRNHFKSLFDSVSKDPDGFAELLSAEDTGIFTELQLIAERKFYIDQYGSAFGNALFEQEYLSNWDAAIIGAVWGDELKNLRLDGRAAPFIYDPRHPVYTSWDIGVGDPTYVLFWQIIGNRPRLIDWYSSTDTGVDHYVEVLSKKPYYYAKHIGPHDIINRGGGSANSWFEQGRKLGLNFERMENTAKLDSIAAGSYLIRQMEVNTSVVQVEDPMADCEFLLSAFTQYRFSFDQERKVMSKNPVHDWTSHPSDALMTFALWFSDQKGIVGRPSQVQGRSAEMQTHDPRRLRDIFAQHQAKRKGAFG